VSLLLSDSLHLEPNHKTYHPGRPDDNDIQFSWNAYDDGGDFKNMSCHNGGVVHKRGGVNNSWMQIVDCEENDSEVLLTKAAMRYIQMASNKSNPEADRPFFIAMGHHR
jgi:hypothetical protein